MRRKGVPDFERRMEVVKEDTRENFEEKEVKLQKCEERS